MIYYDCRLRHDLQSHNHIKLTFHGADTDTDTDTATDFLARIVARMSTCRSACHRKLQRIARVGRVGEDPREDVRVVVGVGVGVVEFHLNGAWVTLPCSLVRPQSILPTDKRKQYSEHRWRRHAVQSVSKRSAKSKIKHL